MGLRVDGLGDRARFGSDCPLWYLHGYTLGLEGWKAKC